MKIENGELRMEKLDGKSRDITADNIQKLKGLFPEAFTKDDPQITQMDAD
jgi:hypothetical protein